jgi:hypothetical protein
MRLFLFHECHILHIFDRNHSSQQRLCLKKITTPTFPFIFCTVDALQLSFPSSIDLSLDSLERYLSGVMLRILPFTLQGRNTFLLATELKIFEGSEWERKNFFKVYFYFGRFFVILHLSSNY